MSDGCVGTLSLCLPAYDPTPNPDIYLGVFHGQRAKDYIFESLNRLVVTRQSTVIYNIFMGLVEALAPPCLPGTCPCPCYMHLGVF